MELTKTQKTIIKGILADQQRLVEDRSYETMRHGTAKGRRIGLVKGAEAGEVPFNVAGWLGREPTGKDRKEVSAAVEALALAGLVERIGGPDGRRTVAVRLTAKGKKAAV